MGAGRHLLCFSIFIIITREKKIKGCCFIKYKDDAIFRLFFPQSPASLCLVIPLYWLSFSGLSYSKLLYAEIQRNETDLLLRTENGGNVVLMKSISDAVFFLFFFFLPSLKSIQRSDSDVDESSVLSLIHI